MVSVRALYEMYVAAAAGGPDGGVLSCDVTVLGVILYLNLYTSTFKKLTVELGGCTWTRLCL